MDKREDIPQDVRKQAWDIYFKRCDEVSRLAEKFEEEEVIDLVARAILKAKNDVLEEAANLLAIDATNATSDGAEIALYKAAHAIRNLKHEG